MIKVSAILLPVLFIAFFFAPAAVVVLILCRHRDPLDYDLPDAPMEPETYGDFRDAMLEDIRWMRNREHEEAWIRGPDGTTRFPAARTRAPHGRPARRPGEAPPSRTARSSGTGSCR